MKKIKVGILGGAFNPPHFGHLLIARQVIEFTPVNQVWLMPAYAYNPIFIKDLAPFDIRLKMTKFLQEPDIKVSSFEKNIGGISHTYKVVKRLKKVYPGLDFSFILGSDGLNTFNKWYRYEDLINLVPFNIFPREKINNKMLFPNMNPVFSPILKTSSLSSSLVKEKIKKGKWKELEKMLAPDLLQYIKSNNLFC